MATTGWSLCSWNCLLWICMHLKQHLVWSSVTYGQSILYISNTSYNFWCWDQITVVDDWVISCCTFVSRSALMEDRFWSRNLVSICSATTTKAGRRLLVDMGIIWNILPSLRERFDMSFVGQTESGGLIMNQFCSQNIMSPFLYGG